MTANMPTDWQPPAPAWKSRWPDNTPMIAAYFAEQSAQPTLLEQWADDCDLYQRAASVERACFRDESGEHNAILISYWPLEDYLSWWSEAGAWWRSEAPLQAGHGFWRECFPLLPSRFETLHSTDQPHGVGVTADSQEGPIAEHGYPGAARDRIADSHRESLRATVFAESGIDGWRRDGGQRIGAFLPANICLIRSGQNWGDCDAGQESFYLERVHPVLKKGMRYLQDNPEESGCLSMRFVHACDVDWQLLPQSFGLGYACDIHAFEDWAKSHPTHLAIFAAFMQMVENYGENLTLRLWHEVAVSPTSGAEVEYINCSEGTGLMASIK